MTDQKQRIAAKKFVEDWTGRGYEKGESQKFWLQLLREVLGVENPEQFISFEDQVHLDHTSFIDARIPATKVLIEQKSSDKDLYKAIKQSDGSLLNPFQQAKRYITELPLSEHPRWVVTCNFRKFCVYDMERPNGEPQEILLKDLEKEYYRLSFLVDTGNEHLRKEMEISIKAGEIVGLLYDAFLKQYIDKNNEETLKSLNILCVRLVFCLYAEDAGIFGRHDMFLDYLKKFETSRIRKALIELFDVLNTKPDDRDPYMEEALKAFPYVNGGLFAQNNIEIPQFTDEIRDLLLEKASANFDWSEISPTIFGAVFESTLNPQTRRKGGMHYTSIENIHKVIDPLFMDELNEEYGVIKSETNPSSKTKKLKSFQDKLASLTFLDPACGSGNFLTETYISLRKLENEILFELSKGQITMGLVANPIKVSISQFYGIEINDFAVTVAKTALWIAESQMMKKTEDIVHMDLDFLPLKTYANIVEGNALRINWEDVIPKDKLNYIMGNPPFVGTNYMSASQRKDMDTIFYDCNKRGKLDYVSAWYKKCSEFIINTNIVSAFVSTNSITQGEQVFILWEPLFNKGLNICFAHQTFRWDSEASLKAHVHCVIIGFTYNKNIKYKILYSNERKQIVQNINAYLINAPNVIIKSTAKPLCSVPTMCKGSQPTDAGNLLLTAEEKNKLVSKYPVLNSYIHLCLGADEYINNKERYCLWFINSEPKIYRDIPEIRVRFQNIKEMRENSTSSQTRVKANIPYLFTDIRQPNTNYLIVPSVSSERRRYVPIGFMTPDIIATNLVLIIPDATLYHFGILTSNVHMAWTRTVCGRLKSDYRYSKDIVYNNFPWCNPTDEQKAKIEKTAQGILDARALYPDCSLADLYDDLTMPPELRKAHQENDKAVMEAYGFHIKDDTTGKLRWLTESETVARLMQMYQELTK
ncbi:MAG: N-6 DNA methylase [Candidatus Gastranaerophilales bacterium]|nr:N-6 DNA methylase [Candidatus Gastranaerophilales bacterium]